MDAGGRPTIPGGYRETFKAASVLADRGFADGVEGVAKAVRGKHHKLSRVCVFCVA